MLFVEIHDILMVVRITLFVLGVSTYKTCFPEYLGKPSHPSYTRDGSVAYFHFSTLP